MADLSVTASSVVPANANTVIARGTAGGTVTAGQPVYIDANSKVQAAANSSATTAAVVGLALNGASNGQPVEYATAGDVTMTTSPVLTLATVYVMGNGAGLISTSADLDASTGTRYGTILGIATSASNLRLAIMPSGVLNP